MATRSRPVHTSKKYTHLPNEDNTGRRYAEAALLWAAVFICIFGVLLIPAHPVIGLVMVGAGFLVLTWPGATS